LVPEDQELEPEAGVRPVAIDDGLEEQTEDEVEEGQNHDPPSWQVGSSPAWPGRYRVRSLLTAQAGFESCHLMPPG
jgi:hypothetical protein